jgi:hypothetical protein
MDIDEEAHARFKALCALHRTTMSAEINAMIAAQLADPDRLLTEALYVRVSPELKQEFEERAQRRRVGLGTLLMEAVAALVRGSESPEGGEREQPIVPSVNGRRKLRPRKAAAIAPGL